MSRTILYPPTIDWHFMPQRPQHLMTQFAKHGWRVLYANKTQVPGATPSVVPPGIEVHHDWARLCGSLQHVDVLWISWAKHHDVPIEAKAVVYDCLDDFSEWEQYEPAMLARADVVVTTSQRLFEKHSQRHKRVVMVRNACDPEHIRPVDYSCPADLARVPTPRVGFVGALGTWTDVELMEKVAARYNLVVVGPEFGKKRPNRAHYLGMKTYEQLPDYYANIKVGIIPFVVNRISIAANPIKMYEYMAAGLPVVATDIPEARLYPGVVMPSRDHGEFIANIERAMSLDLKDKARSVALQNTWEARYTIIADVLVELLEDNGRKH